MKKLLRDDALLFLLGLASWGLMFLIVNGSVYEFSLWAADIIELSGKVVFVTLGVLIAIFVLLVVVLIGIKVLPFINPKLADRLKGSREDKHRK